MLEKYVNAGATLDSIIELYKRHGHGGAARKMGTLGIETPALGGRERSRSPALVYQGTAAQPSPQIGPL